jgi:predicted PurR-regulated permease PerM
VNAQKNRPRRINPRDVFTVLWVTLGFLVALALLWEIRRVLIWLAVAIFSTAVVTPAVGFFQRRGLNRGLSVLTVTILFLLLSAGIIFAFVQPLVDQATEFADDLPELVDRVREAPVVDNLLDRFNVEDRLDETSQDLPQRLLGYSGIVVDIFKTVGEVIIGIVTIFVLTIFLLLYGPEFVSAGVNMIDSSERRRKIREIGNEISRSVSGWVAGNVLTSIIAFVVSLIVFLVCGLNYSLLLALWVGLVDFIPLIGATLGAVPAIIVAFIDSVPLGIIVTIYFIAYQQIENHVLQPVVYGKTIKLNPFIVVMSLLIGVELAGFLGALFALPAAGTIQVLINYAMADYREKHPRSEVVTDESETKELENEK